MFIVIQLWRMVIVLTRKKSIYHGAFNATGNLGCILLGLFWLFLCWFRNNTIHGISISKRKLLHVSDLETESEVT